jgi:hypothetical protein
MFQGKSKFDYSAKLEIEAESAINILSLIFQEEFDLDTNSVSQHKNSYLSESPSKNILVDFVRAVPSKLKWSVQQDGESKCSVYISILTPVYLAISYWITIVTSLIVVGYSLEQMASMNLTYSSFWDKAFLVGVLFSACFIWIVVSSRGITFKMTTYFILYGVLRGIYEKYEIVADDCWEKKETSKKILLLIMLIVSVNLGITVFKANNSDGLSYYNYGIIAVFILLIPTFLQVPLHIFCKWNAIHYKLNINIISFYVAIFLSLYVFFIPLLIGGFSTSVSINFDKNIFGEANITQMFGNELLPESEYRANELSAIENATGKLQITALLNLGIIVFLLITASLVLSLFQGVRMSDYMRGEEESILYYTFEKRFNKECGFDNHKTLRLPFGAKFIIVLQFLVLSCIFWGLCICGFYYLMYLFGMNNGAEALFIEGKFVEETILLGLSLFGNISKTLVYFFVFFMLLVPIVPVIGFLYLQIRSFFVSLRRIKRYVPFDKDNEICKKIHEIADELGVKGVNCIKDPNRNDISPYARIHGIIPKKYIVLTDDGLKFLQKHPEYIEAIIAHEMYHFKDGCNHLWWYSLLSRISLTGAGFLSVLHDMVGMEDKADNFARAYLEKHKMEKTTLDSAIIEILRIEERRKEDKASKRYIGMSLISQFRGDGNHIPLYKRSIKDNISNFFKTFYTLYFDTEWYAYLHRSWRHRCSRR